MTCEQLTLVPPMTPFAGVTAKRMHDFNERYWGRDIKVTTDDFPDGITGRFCGIALTDETGSVKPSHAIFNGDVVIERYLGFYHITNIARLKAFETV